MHQENFLIREPLLNTQERVLGYELKWQHLEGPDGNPSLADTNRLIRFIAEHLDGTDAETLLGDQLMFLAMPAELLKTEALSVLPSQSVVLAPYNVDLSDGEMIETIRQLRASGYGVSLRNGNLTAADKSVLSLFSHIEISGDAPDFDAQVHALRAFELPSAIRGVVRDVHSWEKYDQCAALGLYAFVGQLHLDSRGEYRSRELNPAQAMILQLMEMVRNGADVRQIEGVLKRDAALSYKLLRYINSAGFGLGCEIQSLKHAVTLLGYSPLYRWLALLLATTTTTGYSPVLMQAAVIRGRFAELLGSTFLPKNEAENLFVAGMFSLLDRLLGVPMEDVLEKIQLSETVTQALLAREGMYGPFLALAEACELNSPEVESMAASLCISAHQVNHAQLSALAWVQCLKL